MPINIPDQLPARQILESENVFVMSTSRASHQDIRTLRILILNLMPIKITTETQLLRVLSNTPLQVDVEFLQTLTHKSHNTSHEHLSTFYKCFDEVKDKKYDGMIITGAPVEQIEFEDVDYWDELKDIMEWTKTHVMSTFHICWGAQAGLYYHYGIPKYATESKVFGIFSHRLLCSHEPLMRGFDDTFWAPHSRHTNVRPEDIGRNPNLTILADSAEAGRPPADIRDRTLRIRRHHPARRISARQEQGPQHRHAEQLLPRQRPRRHADSDVARPCTPALLKLAQLLRLPDNAVYDRGNLTIFKQTKRANRLEKRKERNTFASAFQKEKTLREIQ